jgi:adenosylcobinamide kinase/adenosylcobinamide-phosphate guanylyltransferase
MTKGALSKITLVLGGARSGKSAFAQSLAEETGLRPLYVATGRALDEEMEERIRAHKRMRQGKGWSTLEEPLGLAAVLCAQSAADRVVLVDCLTLWLTNLMMDGRAVEADLNELAGAAPSFGGPVIFVSNEVGLGIVPDNRAARVFRDHAGRLHQKIAELADSVYFMAAGLPLKMKG